MKGFLRYSLIIAVIASCSLPAYAQKKRKSDSHAPGEDIQKHYTGTIGNRQVAFDITWGWQGGSNYGGSNLYYRDQPGMKRFYIGEPETFDHDEMLTCEIVPENTKPGQEFFFDRNQPLEMMEFKITGTHIRGKWYSADKKEMQFINAEEDYSESVRFDMKCLKDTTIITNSKNKRFKAEYFFIGAVPYDETKHTGFINGAIAKFLFGETPGKHTIEEHLKINAAQYFSKMDAKRESLNPKFAFNDSTRYDFVKSLQLMPVYNDNGILVLRKTGYIMEPNGFTYDIASYITLDISNELQLALSDILTMDKNKLSTLLEKAFRKRYDVPASKKLNTVLKVGKLPIPDIAIPVHGGLIFSYRYKQIMAENKDDFMKNEVKIFVPYTDLKDMLNPDFKKRIGM